MVNLLRTNAIGGIGLIQLSIALASSPFQSTPVGSLRSMSSMPSPMMKARTNIVAGAGPSIAFAPSRSTVYDSAVTRRLNLDSQARFVPSQQQQTMSSIGLRSRSPRPSTSLFMLPGHIEQLSLIAPLAFWPVVDYLFDLITFMLGLTFMAAAASLVLSESKNEKRGVEPSPAISADGSTLMYVGANDDDILTPETYANSQSAEHQVEDIITSTASEAFDSTDFSREPHLSPELEDAESAFEVALLASAAHELADAAEKENRQSKAAMLERERELEWIEQHDELVSENESGSSVEAMKEMKVEAFQRSLLAAQFVNNSAKISNSNRDAKKQQEGFQRSLLSARIAYESKEKNAVVEQQQKEEWMISEAHAASMGGPECMSFDVASAAASTAAAHALAEVEAEGHEVVAETENVDVVANAASAIAETAERMILGEDMAMDMAFIEHSPESSMQILSGNELKQEEETLVQEVAVVAIEENDHVGVAIHDDDISSVAQWRKDYLTEIQNHVNKMGVEQTRETMYVRNGGNDNLGSGTTDTYLDMLSSKELATNDSENENESILKRPIRGGFLRRVPSKRLLVVALAVVMGRRIFLACAGKALRLL